MVTIDREKCTGCGICLDVCPHECLALDREKRCYLAKPKQCMECGACSLNCPAQAIADESGDSCGCFSYILSEELFGAGKGCCGESKNRR